MDVGHGTALVAGILSFLSPCVLPLIIPYLGFIGGVTLQAGATGTVVEADRLRVVTAAFFFVLGFATVFIALGASATAISQLLAEHMETFALVAGAVLIAFGLHFAGLFRLGFLYREKRIEVDRKPTGPLGAYVVGLAFAFGWTPCVGPILAGILTIAASSQSVGYGASLLAVYAAGIGVPFLLAALFASRFLGFVQRMRRYFRAVELAVGGLLIVTGVMIMTGTFSVIGNWLLETFPMFSRLG
ncbi:cytochrome c biogenesis CcdA family protein [Elioraea thermophila]|uniref:cytochrome c biogenesis CcdA family protein n=1 Tax=Elioraea thermophila TaxID=2185104 RepID=UPI000DF40BE5|nr:cytochrome c biogenesis protein CcdA [Elioraea thermophila]